MRRSVSFCLQPKVEESADQVGESDGSHNPLFPKFPGQSNSMGGIPLLVSYISFFCQIPIVTL